MNGLALCAGAGGLELGLELAIPGFHAVGFVERDAFAASLLVARMGEALLDPAPIWDDLSTFDGRPWRGRVDLVSAGFPCQPWSSAGQRRGTDDARWLWPLIVSVLRDVRPRWVFLENVPGLVSGGGLGPVLSDLHALGFDAEWALFSASGVGAPHERARIFILAHCSDDGREWLEGAGWEAQRRPEYAGAAALADASSDHARGVERDGRGASSAPSCAGTGGEFRAEPGRGGAGDLADPARTRRSHQQGRRAEERAAPEWQGAELADPDRDGCAGSDEGARSGGRLDGRPEPERAAPALADTVRNGWTGLEPAGPAPRTAGGGSPLADASGDLWSFDLGPDRSEQSEQSDPPRDSEEAARELADPDSERLLRRRVEERREYEGASWPEPDGCGPDGRLAGAWRLPLFPPGPAEVELWARVLAEASEVEPAVCRVAHELADRMDRLRTCGNGVVPLEAAIAILALADRAGWLEALIEGR